MFRKILVGLLFMALVMTTVTSLAEGYVANNEEAMEKVVGFRFLHFEMKDNRLYPLFPCIVNDEYEIFEKGTGKVPIMNELGPYWNCELIPTESNLGNLRIYLATKDGSEIKMWFTIDNEPIDESRYPYIAEAKDLKLKGIGVPMFDD